MFATARVSRTFLGAAVVAAALLPGALRADDEPAGDGEDSAAAEARAIVASRVADLTPEELRERARRAGRVRLEGRAHLGGRILAESFEIAPGADVTIEPGTTIVCLGEIRIDAPVRAPAAEPMPALRGFARKAGKGGAIGADGTDAQDVIFSGADVSITQPTQVADGQDGQSVDVAGNSGQGGRGGKGGGVIVQATGTVTISANVIPGRGGRGGDATVTGPDGAAGADGQSVNAACGGKGGKSGDVRVVAPRVVYTFDLVMVDRPAGRIGLRPGGRGGSATATGGKGGDATDCFKKGGNGGAAKAIGGSAGVGTNALVECQVLEQAAFDAHDLASFEPSESPDGGSADAVGGAGGAGNSCFSSDCPAKGRKGGGGGKGGKAEATGGTGGSGGKVGGGKGILRKRPQAQAEASPGVGGPATATGGLGGKASFGEDAQAPGAGGAGGGGGSAAAIGGRGGSSQLGRKFDQPLAGGQGPLQGGRGGDAMSTSGSGGDGGDGGNCCERPGGGGGAAGKGGAPGPSGAIRGLGGFGFTPGTNGNAIANAGVKGGSGVPGTQCPAVVNEFVTMTGDLPNPLFVGKNAVLSLLFVNTGAAAHLKVEICCDGKVFFTFFVDVPAAGMAGPGMLPSISNLHIDSVHAAHHISIMVEGRAVKLFIRPVL